MSPSSQPSLPCFLHGTPYHVMWVWCMLHQQQVKHGHMQQLCCEVHMGAASASHGVLLAVRLSPWLLSRHRSCRGAAAATAVLLCLKTSRTPAAASREPRTCSLAGTCPDGVHGGPYALHTMVTAGTILSQPASESWGSMIYTRWRCVLPALLPAMVHGIMMDE